MSSLGNEQGVKAEEQASEIQPRTEAAAPSGGAMPPDPERYGGTSLDEPVSQDAEDRDREFQQTPTTIGPLPNHLRNKVMTPEEHRNFEEMIAEQEDTFGNFLEKARRGMANEYSSDDEKAAAKEAFSALPVYGDVVDWSYTAAAFGEGDYIEGFGYLLLAMLPLATVGQIKILGRLAKILTRRGISKVKAELITVLVEAIEKKYRKIVEKLKRDHPHLDLSIPENASYIGTLADKKTENWLKRTARKLPGVTVDFELDLGMRSGQMPQENSPDVDIGIYYKGELIAIIELKLSTVPDSSDNKRFAMHKFANAYPKIPVFFITGKGEISMLRTNGSTRKIRLK